MTEEKKDNLPPMEVEHAHIALAKAQRVQGTLLAPGPCPHMFDSLEENYAVYGRVTRGEEYEYYQELLSLTNLIDPDHRRTIAELMAAAEIYTKRMLQIWVEICGLRTFKDQDGVYQGWGPPGDFMMMRVVDYARELEKKYGRIILQHDNKRCDLGATMIGYYNRFIGSLKDKLNIDHSYLRYDTMNIVVYMGKDVTLLDAVDNKKNYIPGQGLKLMREQGKGIIVVDKTSNDTGKDYQELFIPSRGKTLEQCVAEDVNTWAIQYGLIKDGLSTLGLVVGATRESTGEMRALFPTGTFWNPGFGNQGGKYKNVMLDLIREGEWNGQGAISINETAMMYSFREKFGGTGKVADVEKCSFAAVKKHKGEEFDAYQAPEVIDAGIKYPF